MEQRLKKDGKTAYRERGTGSIYPVARSSSLYIKYYDSAGRARIESTGTSDPKKAERILQTRLADARRGLLPSPAMQNTTLGDLIQLVYADYAKKNCRTLNDVETSWRLHLEPYFGERFRASRLTTDAIDKYILHRKGEGARDATIRNELAALRRSFNLGRRSTPPKVTSVPYFAMPGSPNDNARMQFLTSAEYDQLENEVNKTKQLWLRSLIHAAYHTGWRYSELLNMRVHQFDVATGVMTLPATDSKNKQPREIGTSPTTRELLRACVAGKKSDAFIFSRDKDGRRKVGDFRETWYRLCVNAGIGKLLCRVCETATVANTTKERGQRYCPKCKCVRKRTQCRYQGFIWHSFRRTAARDMIRAGVSEITTMAVCGWRGQSMLKRYCIQDAKTTAAGQDRLEAMRKAEREERARQLEQGQFGYTLVAPAPKPDDLRLGTAANVKLEN